MKPKRYPYSGEIKESTFAKADPELVEKFLKPISVSIDFESLITKLQAKNISVSNIICIDNDR